MYTVDQFNISALQEYSGSFLDSVFYGDVLANNATNYIVDLSSSVVTESIDPFQRKRIWSRVDSSQTTALRKENILFSDRLKYKYSKTFGGSRTSNGFMTLVSNGEQWFDSFLPSPLDIGKTNGIKFAFLPGTSGSLEAAPNFNLPSAGANDIPIIFGTTVPAGLSNVADAIDTTWLSNPYPFQARYKNIARKTSTTFTLPQRENVEIDLSTGALIFPVSQSDSVGTIYYIASDQPEGFFNTLYEGEYLDRLTSSEFIQTSFPNGVHLTSSFSGSHAHDFPGGIFGANSEAQQVLFGGHGIIVKRQQGTSGWTIIQEGEPYDLNGAANSRGPNSFGFLQFGVWVFVGTGAKILTNTSYNLSTAFQARTPSDSYAGDFYDVAYECSDTTFTSTNKFVAVGSEGEIQYSSDGYTGATWARTAGSPYGSFKFRSVDYSPKHDVFVAVGDGGRIYYSTTGNPAGTWTQVPQTGNLSGFTDDLYTVKCHYGTTTGHIVVAGANGAIAVCDAFPSSPANWQVCTPANSYTGTFRGSARTSQDSTGGADYLFYLVGSAGMIQAIKDNGATVEEITENPDNTQLQFNTITDRALWPSPVKEWPTTGDYVVAGDTFYTTKNAIGRVVDIESDGYTYLSSSDGYKGFVNTGDVIPLGGSGISANSFYTRSKFEDTMKTFFGFGKGASIALPDGFLPGDINFLPNVSVDFLDKKTIVSDNQLEFFRFIGPKPLGYRYGIYNPSPKSTKCIFRRDHFGHPRDMLEQRPMTKFFLPASDTSNQTVTQGAVVVQFVSGTSSYDRAKTYLTASSEVSFNKKDSGIYDFECKSGQPFFDNQLGLED